MAAGTGQPNNAGFMLVEMDDLTVIESAGVETLAPAGIINEPNTFTLNTKFTISGPAAGLVAGKVFDVQHHTQRVEDGANKRLSGGTVTAGPVVAGKIEMVYQSPAFTTGTNGSAKDLEIAPAPDTEGTFRVLTQLVAQDPNIRGIVAAFHDGLLLHII
jgi:hypothetical protein